MADAATDTRLDELESRVEFQEDTIAGLNEALVRQQQRMDKLEAALQLIVDRLDRGHFDAGQDAGGSPPEPPPPHY